MAGTMNTGSVAFATTPIERRPMDRAGSTSMAGSADVQMFDNREKVGGMDARMNHGSQPQMNGGGPEPQAPGSQNPGGQIDTGGLGTKFFERAQGHMGGDDGVQNAVEKPAPMRMGGVVGTPPNPGQRGGQNTETSGSQTSARRDDIQHGGASGIDTLGGAQEWGSGGTQQDTSTGGTMGEGMGANTGGHSRNPIGFASGGMSTDAKRKSKDLMNNAKNKLEEFFDNDIDGDGSIGARNIGGGLEGEPYGDSATGTYPYDARSRTRELSVA